MTNETPNEKNYKLLEQRFEKEKQLIPANEVEDIVRDGTGNELYAYTENGIVYPVRNENGEVLGFENRGITGNETASRFENEPRNETKNGNENQFRNEHRNENETGNETLIGNELITAMKNEILFYSADITFPQKNSLVEKKDRIHIRIINEDNIGHIFNRYLDTINYFLEKEYLLPSEAEDFQLASKRLNGLRKIYIDIRKRGLRKYVYEPVFDDKDDESEEEVDNNTDYEEDLSLLQKIHRFLCGEYPQ